MDNQPENKAAVGASEMMQQFSVGAALREAREQLGLSVSDVANRIKFAPRQIEAMEADDFAQLPELTFVRGFIRSYARLLEMDAAPLLAALPQKQAPHSAVAEKKAVEVPFPSLLTARRTNMIWYAAAVLVAVALVIFARLHDSSSGPVQNVTQTSVETLELPLAAASAPVADALPAEPVAANAATAGKPAVTIRVPVAAPSVKAPVLSLQQAREQALPVKDKVNIDNAPKVKPAIVPEAQVKAVPQKLPKELPVQSPVTSEKKQSAISATNAADASSVVSSMRLVFDEDSWVDVKDANGKILISRMNHAGSLVRLSGVAPLSVVIGHASGVHVFFKGKEVNLAPYTSVEVARLLLE